MNGTTSEQPGALSPGRLDAAVARGILSREQADRLAEFWTRQERLEDAQAPVSHVDAEEVRFARGFHDVFISIGIVILLFGLLYGLHEVAEDWVVACAGTAVVWGLSEVFAKRMRLALPSFLLSIAFAPMFLMTCLTLFIEIMPSDLNEGVSTSDLLETSPALPLLLPVLIALAGAVLHYRRFKVPVGVTGIVGCCLFLLVVLLEALVPNLVVDNVVWFTLLAGLLSFALAMVFDSRDPKRITLNSDKAFWLHLMAAPLIVHSVLALATADADLRSTTYAATAIGLFVVLAFAAILVDRRALLVSGLGYFGFAVTSLMLNAEMSHEASFAVTLVLLGSFILLLGSAWRRVRKVVVRPLATTPVMNLVPAID